MSSTEIKKKKETRQNKKGTDIYHFDLRQDVAWNLYTDQRSDTFNNAYKSAVKAGFTDLTSRSITTEAWWINKVNLLVKMLPLAEKNIVEDLEMDITTPVLVDGEIKYKNDPALRKIRSEMTRFVASTVGRSKYHTKTEIESNNIISLVEGNSLLDNLFKKGK